MQPPSKAVLVTGASTGIGRATVELLAASGFRVFGGVRRHGGTLGSLPARVTPVELDVTRSEDVASTVALLERECPEGLFALINNAGIAPPAAVELADLDEVRRLMEINVIGSLRMIQACLPLLRRGGGRIINMSSMNGTVATPIVGAYSASKFAVEAISTALRMELRPWGIPVSVIRPGQIRTEIFDKAGEAIAAGAKKIPPELVEGYGPLYESGAKFGERGATKSQPAEAVAKKILKVLRTRSPRDRYYVGWDAIWLQIGYEYSATKVFEWCVGAAMGLNRKIAKK